MTETKSLITKLSEVMDATRGLQKRGENKHFRYNYVTADDVSDLVRTELANHRVMFIPQVDAVEVSERKGSKGTNYYVAVQMTMRFVDGDSGEVVESTWFTEGLDAQDKGIAKAITAGVKGFLLKAFLMSTNEDEHADEAVCSEAQLTALKELVSKKGKKWSWLADYVKNQNGLDLNNLPSRSFDGLIGWVRGWPDPGADGNGANGEAKAEEGESTAAKMKRKMSASSLTDEDIERSMRKR